MSKHQKKQKALPEKSLSERIEKARQEGRTQQALDLTRQFAKHEQTEAHQELLRQVTLERGQQLQAQGMLKDAITVFTNALTLGGTVEYRTRVAEHLAASGATRQAFDLIHEIPDKTLQQRIIGQAVDAALARGPAGKEQLPAELHAPFEQIVRAFNHSEAGRDEETRAELQAIGLQSPFLEWKVLLRGLLAYYGNDDGRAVENWQRLDAQRLPARIAAPLRFSFDKTYRQAQPPASQPLLQRQMDKLQGPTSVTGVLQGLKHDLAQDNLAPAFRRAEQAVATLRRDRPDLVTRLGHCFAWAILDHGQPEDLDRYRRVFGAPADDPNLFRLEAMALEMRGMLPEAHEAWQSFIGEVAKAPQHWPGEAGQYVQAMIWARMAENASEDGPKRKKAISPLFGLFGEPPPANLKPDTEACLKKAIALAPNRLDSYLKLFDWHLEAKQLDKAKKVGHDVLKRFPQNAFMLEALGELHLESKEYEQAQSYFAQAWQANPLDRSLRGRLARARQKWGLELVLAGKFEPARAQYEQALKFWDGAPTSLLCQWAAAEMKAKNAPRAEELIAQVQAMPDQRLACRYALVCESVRAKLTPKQKKELNEELKAALAEAPTPAEILVLLEVAAQQRETHAETFRGQKTQEKTILKFLDQLSFDQFSESQLERLCAGLQGLQARKPWQNALEFARRRFLKNPVFRLSWVDYYLTGPSPEGKTHLAREHLDQARRLAETLPRGEQQQQLQEQIKEREEDIAKLSAGSLGMLDVMERLFGGAFGGGPLDEDEEYWDDDF